ncbi:hypothetical protein AAY473_012355 [Plecturocebus cupreus]
MTLGGMGTIVPFSSRGACDVSRIQGWKGQSMQKNPAPQAWTSPPAAALLESGRQFINLVPDSPGSSTLRAKDTAPTCGMPEMAKMAAAVEMGRYQQTGETSGLGVMGRTRV